eukprot:871230-Pyramimonas_sp.AAC.1
MGILSSISGGPAFWNASLTLEVQVDDCVVELQALGDGHGALDLDMIACSESATISKVMERFYQSDRGLQQNRGQGGYKIK